MSKASLFNTVVEGGYCIGCGACAALDASGIDVAFTELGTYCAITAVPVAQQAVDPEDVCPFSDASIDEDELSASLFPQAEKDAQIGRYLSTYAGWVEEGEYRAHGSSGGLVTWIAAQLLDSGMIDGVAHVSPRQPTPNDERLFTYTISRDSKSLRAGSKSRYYPVEMSEVLREIARVPGRYVVIGLPCFIKAVRLLQRNSRLFSERIAYTIGLVCGHLKSSRYAELLAWQMGVKPGELKEIDFRLKLNGRSANNYAVSVRSSADRAQMIKPVSDLFGCDWGAGLLKYKACDFCDDVVAETADVSVGDAWLPEYVSDSRGTNVLVIRAAWAQRLVADGMSSNKLALDSITPHALAKSQAAGLRHRREGLRYRLRQARSLNTWAPRKRFTEGDTTLPHDVQRKYALRSILAMKSQTAFAQAREKSDLNIFYAALAPYLSEYSPLVKRPLSGAGAKKRCRSLRRWLAFLFSKH
jgi:coenzyme F420 hydrogenase subunit beta